MPGLGGLRGIGAKLASFFRRGASAMKTIPKASGAANAARVSRLSKIGSSIKQLPVIRLIAGSAVAVTILNGWDSLIGTITDQFGIDPETAEALMFAAAALGVFVLIRIIFGKKQSYIVLKKDGDE